MTSKFYFLIVFLTIVFSSSINFAFSQGDDYGGYSSWDEYCKATYGSDYYYDYSTDLCDTQASDYNGYSSWDEYCKATYGSDYYYDYSTDLCDTNADDYGGYSSWDEYCKATYGSEYFYDVKADLCDTNADDYGGYSSWNQYCKATFGAEYFYDVKANLCDTQASDYNGYSSWDKYCKATYGSDHSYDSKKHLCIIRNANVSTPVTPPPSSHTSSISVKGTVFSVDYTIVGGDVSAVTTDVDTQSLIITMDSTHDNGQLTITLPRALIDAQLSNNVDDTFFVLVDGKEIDFDETKTKTDRTLTVSFETGDEEIEIIGTSVYASKVQPIHTSSQIDVTVSIGSSSPGCEKNNSCYKPYSISVKTGDTVTWHNKDSASHTVTSGSSTGGPDGLFDSSLFLSGATFSHTFSNPGNYNYYCMVHPWMKGEVSVSGK